MVREKSAPGAVPESEVCRGSDRLPGARSIVRCAQESTGTASAENELRLPGWLMGEMKVERKTCGHH